MAARRSAASCTSSATLIRAAPRNHPRLLLVAPMSGHFATLLRGTVETFLPDHEVYITDWQDAREVPLSAGRFDLDDYIDVMAGMFRFFGGDVHVFAVCQPSVPVLAATALMEADGDPHVPLSLILAGGPIDTRISPDGGQQAGRGARHRLVPPQRHHQRALAAPGPRPAGLSGLPAAVGLHDHEPRPAHAGAQGHVPASGARRRRLGREAPRVLRRVSGRDGPDGRVLPADGRHRVRAAPDAARADDASRPRRSISAPSAVPL